MKRNRIACALVAVVLLTPALFAVEDLTGKWEGAFNTSLNNGVSKPERVYFVLKHSGKELTGTAGPNADLQWAIQKGSVVVAGEPGKETTKVTFALALGDGAGPVLTFDLALVDGHLKGSAVAENEGMKMIAAVDVARVK